MDVEPVLPGGLRCANAEVFGRPVRGDQHERHAAFKGLDCGRQVVGACCARRAQQRDRRVRGLGPAEREKAGAAFIENHLDRHSRVRRRHDQRRMPRARGDHEARAAAGDQPVYRLVCKPGIAPCRVVTVQSSDHE